jgi:hypothetical protein
LSCGNAALLHSGIASANAIISRVMDRSCARGQRN